MDLLSILEHWVIELHSTLLPLKLTVGGTDSAVCCDIMIIDFWIKS